LPPEMFGRPRQLFGAVLALNSRLANRCLEQPQTESSLKTNSA